MSKAVEKLKVAKRSAAAMGPAAIAGVACILLIFGFVLRATLTVSHPGGFTMLLDAYGAGVAQGWAFSALSSGVYPLSPEYYYYSRPGLVWLLGGLSVMSNSLDFVTVMPLVAALAALAAVAFVTRVGRHPAWIAALSVLFFPILLEAGFFANDNILAATFALAGLAALGPQPDQRRALAAGALISLAVLARLDHVVSVALGAALILMLSETWRRAALVCVAFVAGVAIVQLAFNLVEIAAGLAPATLWRRVEIVRAALAAWGRDASVIRDAASVAMAIGPGFIPLAVGAAAIVASTPPKLEPRAVGAALFFVLIPLAFLAVYLGKMYDPRALLAWAPALLLLIARGVATVVDALSAPHGRLLKGAALAAALAAFGALFAPTPSFSPFITKEAPEIGPTGRLFQTAAWRAWQAPRRDIMTEAHRVLAALEAEPGRAAALSTAWDDGRALENALARRGYGRAAFAAGAPQGCRLQGELWRRGEREVVHITLHIPFTAQIEQDPRRALAALALGGALDCLETAEATRRFAIALSGAARGPHALDEALGAAPAAPVAALDAEAVARVRSWSAEVLGCEADCAAEARGLMEDVHDMLRSRARP